jgi:hypothetical protein
MQLDMGFPTWPGSYNTPLVIHLLFINIIYKKTFMHALYTYIVNMLYLIREVVNKFVYIKKILAETFN